MNSQSPFAAIQELQEEQREGWMSDHQQTRAEWLHSHGAPKNWLIYTQAETNVLQLAIQTYKDELAEKDAKLAEQAAQIVALRDVCNVAYKTPRGESLSDHALECLEQALSTPAPPCVLMEDVTPLLDALKIIAANPGASHGPNFLYDSGPISTGAIAKFTTKYPQP